MRTVRRSLLLVAVLASPMPADAQPITAAGQPAQLDVRVAGERSIRVTLKPVAFTNEFPENPAVAPRPYPPAALSLRDIKGPVQKRVGSLTVDVRHRPLTLTVRNTAGQSIQELVFENDGTLSFKLDDSPVLGMGEGGPRPARGTPWRQQAVQFDRRGQLDTMQPRWQADMYGSRNPVAMLLGTGGWGMFVAAPWGQIDLRNADRGVFLPWKPTDAERAPQTERNQQQALAKGLPPPDRVVPGLYDIFVFDAHDPAVAMKDFSVITGPAAMPPRWALGYMQSHRTLEDDNQMLGIVETFRKKRIPLDAVIYLGTGFVPRGWNTRQPSFDFNPEVFKRDPKAVIADMHARNAKVVVHMVPWDRDRLPTLHGTIPPRPGETLDGSHIQNYWQQHVPLVKIGIDAFWPDEGDWFNLFERIKRHQLYCQGHLSTQPNVRPWSLQRNGHPGIAQWGGWVWSGDTDSSWKTLEAQIAVGINYSLSIGPYWGSDIGGFYPNNELTGELYARWFQFAAFCGSFRSHGRVWWARLPWGWGLSDRGPQEYGNNNAPIPADDRRNILLSEMNNPAIEPVAKKYAELRYQLLPYTYTLAWEARATGMPLMRAMWLHYPDDERVRGLGTQFLWGRDLLIAPVFTKGAPSREVYLPAGDWYDWWTNAKSAGGRNVTRPVDLATMPIYVRAGAIIPFDPVRQYTSEPVSEPTTLRIYGGADGEYTLYEDDGISQDYVELRGTWTRITWNDRAKRLTIEPGAPKGATNVTTTRAFRVLLLPEGTTREVTYAGKRIQITFAVPFAQEKPPGTTPAARPMRTEAEARARAEANRRDREQQRLQTGTPVELIADYVEANIGPVPDSLGVSPFYKKYTDALGIPVIASDKVPDAALLVARDIVNTMLAARPDIRTALIARRWRTGVIAEVEMTMDIPEYSKMKRPGAPRDEPVTQADRDYHANRSRGLGGNPTTGAEENLLGYPGTRYWGEHIFVHEFAHAIMGGGIRHVDPAMFAEIRAAYDQAMAAGKYVYADGRKHYATTNAGEYWAEGVQWWFFSNYGECFAGNVKVETPEEFAAYDPTLHELIGRVFTTHRIPMDVFHGKRIRPVACGSTV